MAGDAWSDALPPPLRELQERAPVMVVFLRHFG
jgi:hypothetical protein